MYFVNLLQDDMKIPITPILVHEDNKAAIEMVKQLMSNSRTAHIANNYHWVREHVRDKKNFRVQHLSTELMCADIFTKALGVGLFEKHRNFIMNHIPDADSK